MTFRKREEIEAVSGDLVLQEVMDLPSDSPRDDDKLNLFSLTQHRFILIQFLNSKCGYVFRPVLRTSKVM